MNRVRSTDVDGDSLMITAKSKARNVSFVLLGVGVLLLKRYYPGPFVEIIHSYSGNVSASFAVYFVVRILTSGWRYGRLVAAGIALLVVELFEATNGFGVMTNVYDPVDFAANAVGIVLALVIDALVWFRRRNKLEGGEQ